MAASRVAKGPHQPLQHLFLPDGRIDLADGAMKSDDRDMRRALIQFTAEKVVGAALEGEIVVPFVVAQTALWQTLGERRQTSASSLFQDRQKRIDLAVMSLVE
ncbi:MAG TPA: hypothetical protein VN808_01430 [Stellaceae bacterium]|nr:hypothetical protein [Stellaceae bacterium]